MFTEELNLIKAVSYTHLDVYKRQDIGCAAFCDFLSVCIATCRGKVETTRNADGYSGI